LGHESIGGVDDYFIASGLQGRQCQSQLRAGALMTIKGGKVEVSVIVKGKERERYPNDATRLAINKLYRNVGHACPTPGKMGYTTSCRILAF
jgi:RNA-splicing ligase RtcB